MAKKICFASGGSNFSGDCRTFPVEFVFRSPWCLCLRTCQEEYGVASHDFELKEFDNKVAYEEAIVKLLNEHQIDLVCLAGYMKSLAQR